MITPRPAVVRPRVLVPGEAGPLVLEDEIADRLESGWFGLIELRGGPGSGKTTALEHLAHVFGDHPALLLIERFTLDDLKQLEGHDESRVMVCAEPPVTFSNQHAEHWQLSPWGQDDWIEYLVATHRAECASVLQRVRADDRCGPMAGNPRLWRIVLDRLAEDSSLQDVTAALRSELDVRLPTPEDRRLACMCSYAMLVDPKGKLPIAKKLFGLNPSARQLLWHACIQTMLAGEHVARLLRDVAAPELLGFAIRPPIVNAAAETIRDDDLVIGRLRKILAGRTQTYHAMAASLLHATGRGWKPESKRAPHLIGAHLAGIRWPAIRLARLDISYADLSDADLHEAQLKNVTAYRTNLSNANLKGAMLKALSANTADFSGANLSNVRAPCAIFGRATLRGACLEGAELRHARFYQCDLRGARFNRADLSHASLSSAQLDEADFSNANLSQSILAALTLRVANFRGASFVSADLARCDLEGMELPGAVFDNALLRGAYLTGTRMPRARFCRANLTNAGLAEIEWEGADLRDADLRGATFHLGSSRSGLVGSPIASEGSRTGFYTDELFEQDFKAPEEIRKANLCHADLRGANIDGVDFYLVDLRHALYTPDQEQHFRRSGAILETRV